LLSWWENANFYQENAKGGPRAFSVKKFLWSIYSVIDADRREESNGTIFIR